MKKSIASGLVLASSALLLLKGRSTRQSQRARTRRVADETARRYIRYVIFPAWSAAGFLDWLWHRQTKIETTSGQEESITHALMMVEVGVPILMGMFLEINAGVLGLMGLGWFVHEATVAWDVG